MPVDVPQKKGDPLRVDTDEYPRAGTTAEKLAALKPAFKKDGTVTAGNASGINDGAAALVVTTAAKAKQVGTPPLARILAYVSTGVDPKIMGIGPVPAVRKVLDRAGLTMDRIDLFELNEAFAAQSLAVMRELRCGSRQGERARRRHRARTSDRRQRRAGSDHADLRAAGEKAALRRRGVVHRRRHGHRDGGGGVIAVRLARGVLDELPPTRARRCRRSAAAC